MSDPARKYVFGDEQTQLEPSIKQFLDQDEMVFTVIRLRRPSALNKRIFACLEVSPQEDLPKVMALVTTSRRVLVTAVKPGTWESTALIREIAYDQIENVSNRNRLNTTLSWSAVGRTYTVTGGGAVLAAFARKFPPEPGDLVAEPGAGGDAPPPG